MDSLKQKQTKIMPKLVEELKLKNAMAAPRLTKVVINSGVGSRREKGRADLIVDRLAKITGQKPALRGAKKAIATFKSRQGDIVGITVTLRGQRMFGFLDKVLNVAIPRMRDFRGLSIKGVDHMGNYTMGLKENTIFPETTDEDLRDVFGFAATICTTAKSKAEAEALFKALGFPFKKKEEAKELKEAKKAEKKKKKF